MIRRPPRSTLERASAASDVYKRQVVEAGCEAAVAVFAEGVGGQRDDRRQSAISRDRTEPRGGGDAVEAGHVDVHQHQIEPAFARPGLSLIQISEPTGPY